MIFTNYISLFFQKFSITWFKNVLNVKDVNIYMFFCKILAKKVVLRDMNYEDWVLKTKRCFTGKVLISETFYMAMPTFSSITPTKQLVYAEVQFSPLEATAF